MTSNPIGMRAIELAAAESKVQALEAENYALQDQGKGLQQLMAWVPVTERKPERDKLVLVAFDNHEGKNYTTAKLCQDGRAHFDCEAWYVQVSGGQQLRTVTHWCDFERVPVIPEPEEFLAGLCPFCCGSGLVSTGITESPSTICETCEGTGKTAQATNA